jgi:2-dehydropantoate 2-reductase
LEKSILILGTGALATFFAANLSAANIDVTMLGTWKEAIDILNTHGAGIEHDDGTVLFYPVHATADPLACKGARCVLVLVKAWQTQRASLQLESCLAMDGLAVTLQNGLGNREVLAATLGLHRVSVGVTTSGATLIRPGLVRMGGNGSITLEAHTSLAPMEDMLRYAAFDLQVVDDAEALIWRKLIVNAAVNPLTAILDVPNGRLLETQHTREMMAALAQETASVAIAQGVRLAGLDVVRMVEEIVQKTAANHSSMLQDVQRGTQTEIDAICGAIVKIGQQYDVPVPYNWMMWKLVHAMFRGNSW